MNPPLRTPKDVEALKQGLKDGTIEVISTDHAPHSTQGKTGSMKNAPLDRRSGNKPSAHLYRVGGKRCDHTETDG